MHENRIIKPIKIVKTTTKKSGGGGTGDSQRR
jgi:hypothetical protein